jgi:hypothetical protein
VPPEHWPGFSETERRVEERGSFPGATLRPVMADADSAKPVPYATVCNPLLL